MNYFSMQKKTKREFRNMRLALASSYCWIGVGVVGSIFTEGIIPEDKHPTIHKQSLDVLRFLFNSINNLIV